MMFEKSLPAPESVLQKTEEKPPYKKEPPLCQNIKMSLPSSGSLPQN